jgi:forkhead transcription factor HCM1
LSPVKGLSPLKAPLLKSSTSNPSHDFVFPGSGTDKENGRSGITPPKCLSAPSTQQHQQQQEDDDIFHLLHSDESEPGIDLLQGFEKIGARPSAVAPNGSPSKVSGRPSLSRSTTSRF